MVYFTDIRKMYLFTFLVELTFFGAIAVPFFIEWGKLNYAQIFVLEAWFISWVFLLEIPTGVVADRVGRKYSLFLGSLIGAIGFAAYTIAPNFYWFLLGEFIVAIALAFMSGADTALIYDLLKKQKKQKQAKLIFSRYRIFNTLGIVIGAPAGSVIAGMVLWPYPTNLTLPFLLTAVPLLAGSLVALTIKEKRKVKFRESYTRTAINGVKYLSKHKILRVLATDLIVISGTLFFMFWFYQSLMGKYGINIAFNGFVTAGFSIFSILLLMKIGAIEKLVGTRRMLFLSALIPGLFYLGLAWINSFVFAIFAIFVITSLGSIRRPIFDHYMNSYIKSKDRATVLSTISMFGRLFIGILYPLVGILADISLESAFLILGVLTIIFAVVFRTSENILK